MSRENVELIAQGYAVFQETGDFATEQVSDDFVWDMSTFRGWPETQVYQGVDGAREFMGAWLSAFEDWSMELLSLHDAGEDVVGVVRQTGRSKSTGLPVDMTFAQVWTTREGKQTRMRMFADPAEAFAAVGLPDGGDLSR